MLIQTPAQQKAERSRTPQLRYNDKWAKPGLVDLILKYLPYRTERTTVVAALREFRGRVSYALDYLMPGKGIAELSNTEPGYDDYFEDPPTPGKAIDFDLRDDDPFTPWEGIDFDQPEDDLPMLGEDPNAQQNEHLWAYLRILEERINAFQEDLAALKTQLDGALQQHR